MFKGYLKTAYRHFAAEKVYSLMSVVGLSLGLAVFMLTLQVSYVGFRYDKFHANSRRLYGVVQVQPTGREGDRHLALAPGPMGLALADAFPEVESSVRLVPASRRIVRYGDKKFYEDRILYVEANFLSIFSFGLISGNRELALSRPDSVILTETTARKYFGEADPLGQRLQISGEREAVVAAVIRDVPLDSSIRFDFLLPLERLSADTLENWTSSPFATFLLLRSGENPKRLEDKFPDFLATHFGGAPDAPRRLYLLSITRFFHRPQSVISYLQWNSPGELYIALVVGFLMLLIVSLNCAGLSIARSLNRAREIAVRKVVGATKGCLVGQFMGESALLALVSLVLAFPLFSVIQSFFISLFGRQPEATVSVWNSPVLILTLAVVTLLTGILAGLYPALFLSRYPAVSILREGPAAGRRSGRVGRIRKILLVAQFGLSVFFILFSLAAEGQYDYLLKRDFGFDKNNVLVLSLNQDVVPRIGALKQSLKGQAGVLNAAAASLLPVKAAAERAVIPEGLGRAEALTMDVFDVGLDFIELFGIRLTQGRSLSRDGAAGETELVINETAARYLGWAQPLGKRLSYGGESGIVVGVARDFQFRNMIYPTPPTILALRPERSRYLFLKLDASRPAAAVMPAVKGVWDAVAPDVPLDAFPLDGFFGRAYGDIRQVSLMIRALGVATILFSCLGMLGLVSSVLKKKTKEIGIRKTLGASALQIFRNLFGEFVRLVILANLIAQPLAYVVLDKLMQTGYAFSADIRIAGYVLVALLSVLVAGGSILQAVITAARQNPVHSLRYE